MDRCMYIPLILVFDEWYKLHIKFRSLSSDSPTDSLRLKLSVTHLLMLPNPSCLNPACWNLILENCAQLTRFYNCDDAKKKKKKEKRWIEEMALMTTSSRFKLTREPQQWIWKKILNNDHRGDNRYESASRISLSDYTESAPAARLPIFFKDTTLLLWCTWYNSIYGNLRTLFQV